MSSNCTSFCANAPHRAPMRLIVHQCAPSCTNAPDCAQMHLVSHQCASSRTRSCALVCSYAADEDDM
eukprot:216763-Chlamydomonas_euryale.AAC.1